MSRILFILALFFVLVTPVHAAWVFPDKSTDVVTNKTALSDTWNLILTQAKTYAFASVSATSHLPKVEVTVMTNKKITLDLRQYESEANVMGSLLFFCGLLLSFFIIFS